MPDAAILVLTSLPDHESARRWRATLVTGRLAACVNVGAPVESMYHWRGRNRNCARGAGGDQDPQRRCIRRWRRPSVAATPTNFRRSSLSPSAMDSPATSTGSHAETLGVAPRQAVGARWRSLALGWRAPAPGRTPSCCRPSRRSAFRRGRSTTKTLEARFSRDRRLLPVPRQDASSRSSPAAGARCRRACRRARSRRTSSSARSRPTAGDVVVRLPLRAGAAGKSLVLVADSQGCADVGVCYPPTTARRSRSSLPGRARGPAPSSRRTPRKKNWFN